MLHLVPDPAGAVLVHHEVAVGGGPLQAHAAAHHGAGEARRLLGMMHSVTINIVWHQTADCMAPD